MYLSRLLLDPIEPRTARTLSRPYLLHQAVMAGFDPDERGETRVLYRVEPERPSGKVILLVQSVMSKRAGPSAQGELQGAVASLSSIAAVLSPLFMTQLFSHFSAPDAGVHFPGAPYLVSAVLVLLCVLICARAVVVVPSRENADAPRA